MRSSASIRGRSRSRSSKRCATTGASRCGAATRSARVRARPRSPSGTGRATRTRVVMTSTTSRQVDQILWRELRMRVARAGRCLACIAADPDGRRIPRPCPHSAIIVDDVHVVCGGNSRARASRATTSARSWASPRAGQAVAGVSGKHLLYIVDRASGVPDVITRRSRATARAARPSCSSATHEDKRRALRGLHAEEASLPLHHGLERGTPNAVSGRCLVPGLAERRVDRGKLRMGRGLAAVQDPREGVHAENGTAASSRCTRSSRPSSAGTSSELRGGRARRVLPRAPLARHRPRGRDGHRRRQAPSARAVACRPKVSSACAASPPGAQGPRPGHARRPRGAGDRVHETCRSS